MPETLHLHGDRRQDVERAALILQAGGLVAFPTETVYGLGANALSAEAVARIFLAKQRPSWDPLIVHLADAGQVGEIAVLEGVLRERVDLLARAFWPGPLTLLLPRAAVIPDLVTAGRPLVGVRVPAHPAAQALLRATGLPLAAPSANRFGHTSPTTALHVLDDLRGRIDAVLDGGPTPVGIESAVLDPAPTPMILYRAGAVTADAIEAVLGVPVEVFKPHGAAEEPGVQESLPAPGVGLRHYAPEAELLLTKPDLGALRAAVLALVAEHGAAVGVLLPSDWQWELPSPAHIQPWGRWDDPWTLAAGLFAGLRALEGMGVAVIACPLPPPGGLRDALRDRLLKAAKPR